MRENVLKNNHWLEQVNQHPVYFRSNGKLHFDQTMIKGYKIASLCLIQGEYERLVYELPVELTQETQLTMGLIIRGNEIHEINYKVAFYGQNNECIDLCENNVAPEITTQFKRICVTYPVPIGSYSVKVGWEFKGLTTGLTIFAPSLICGQ